MVTLGRRVRRFDPSSILHLHHLAHTHHASGIAHYFRLTISKFGEGGIGDRFLKVGWKRAYIGPTSDLGLPFRMPLTTCEMV